MRAVIIAIVSLSLLPACCTHNGRTQKANEQVAAVGESLGKLDLRNLLRQQDPSRYWRLRSQMTTAEVAARFDERKWKAGMRLADLTRQLGSVPVGSLETIVFALADGTLTCELDEDRFLAWRIQKSLPETAGGHGDVREAAGDPHRNAYFRVQGYEQDSEFLDVPLDDVPAAIRRAERATYSDLVGGYLEHERSLFVNGCSCGWCRRPLNSIDDPKQRASVQAHHQAWADALRSLASRLDAQGIRPPSHLKPLVIEKMPYAYVRLYIPLDHIRQLEKAEHGAAADRRTMN